METLQLVIRLVKSSALYLQLICNKCGDTTVLSQCAKPCPKSAAKCHQWPQEPSRETTTQTDDQQNHKKTIKCSPSISQEAGGRGRGGG